MKHILSSVLCLASFVPNAVAQDEPRGAVRPETPIPADGDSFYTLLRWTHPAVELDESGFPREP